MNMSKTNLFRRSVVLLLNGLIAAVLIQSYAAARVAQLGDLARGVPSDILGAWDYLWILLPLFAIVLEFISFRASWLYSVGWLVVVSLSVLVGLTLALMHQPGFSEPEHWYALLLTVSLPAFVLAACLHFLFKHVRRHQSAAA